MDIVNFRGAQWLAEIDAFNFGSDHRRGWPHHDIRLGL
jgi:hypothetical protein